MSKRSFTSLIILGAALAACSNGDTRRTLTAPASRAASSEAPAGAGFGVTADGPFDIVLESGEASPLRAAAPQAASGGRASGHVGFNFNPSFVGLATEEYSFTALSTDAATFAAKGEFELHLSTPSGFENKAHGDVICMSTVGNVTRLAAQLTKLWVNNVQRTITTPTYVIWTVIDNGEGQGSTDTASPMFFNPIGNAQFHCTVGLTPPQVPLQQGNVQVQP